MHCYNVVIDGREYQPVRDETGFEMAFSDYIKLKREVLKLTLDEASKLIGCSKSYLWEMENKGATPSLLLALEVARAYAFGAKIYETLIFKKQPIKPNKQ